MANKDTREEKDIIAQITFLEMYYTFKTLRKDALITEFYEMVIPNIVDEQRSKKYRALMLGHDASYKWIIDGMKNSLNFEPSIYQFKVHLFDYKVGDEDVDISESDLKRFAFAIYNSDAEGTRSRKYKSKGDEKIVTDATKRIEKYVNEIAELMTGEDENIRKDIDGSNIGKFIKKIKGVAGGEVIAAKEIIDALRVLINKYDQNRSELARMAAVNDDIIKGIRDNYKDLYRITDAFRSIITVEDMKK